MKIITVNKNTNNEVFTIFGNTYLLTDSSDHFEEKSTSVLISTNKKTNIIVITKIYDYKTKKITAFVVKG